MKKNRIKKTLARGYKDNSQRLIRFRSDWVEVAGMTDEEWKNERFDGCIQFRGHDYGVWFDNTWFDDYVEIGQPELNKIPSADTNDCVFFLPNGRVIIGRETF